MKLTRYTMSQRAIEARIKGGKAATAHYTKKEWVTTSVTKENRDFANERFGGVNAMITAIREGGNTKKKAR